MRRNRVELTIELTRVEQNNGPDQVWAKYFHAGRTLSVAAVHRPVPTIIDELSVELVRGEAERLHHWLTGRMQVEVGRALFDLLFPDAARGGDVLAALRLDSRKSLAHYAFRIRIVTDDARWAGLPWSLTTCRYQRLTHVDNGWTFEVTDGVRPKARDSGHQTVPRILVFAPAGGSCRVEGHLARIRGALARQHRNYGQAERDHFLVVGRLSELEKIARGSREVGIVYLLAPVLVDPTPRLVLGGADSVALGDLARMLTPLAPAVVLVNGAGGAAALPITPLRQLGQVADAVIAPCGPADPRALEPICESWFDHHVIGGRSPVDALYAAHPTETAIEGAWSLPMAHTAYAEWVSRPLGLLRPDVAVRLDRFNQRAHAARKVKELLFQAPERRLQLLVAVGSPGNAIEELSSHLHHDLAMSEPDWQMIRQPVAFPPERSGFEPSGEDWSPREMGLAVTRMDGLLVDALAAGDRIPLLDAVAYAVSDALPGKTPLLWLDWGAYGDRASLASDERLGLRDDCSSDMLALWLQSHRHLAELLRKEKRINVVSFIGLEKPAAVLPYIENDIIGFSNAGHSHIGAHMLPPLHRVERHELLEFLRDDPNVAAPREHLQTITETLLDESRGDYDRLITAIARAEKTGWRSYLRPARQKKTMKY